jgi:hypothetical protein
MLSMHSNVVALFLSDGGRISKLKATVAVTEQELLDYLRMCGVEAEYVDESFYGYLFAGRRVNLSLLLDLANRHRCSHKLPPLTIRHIL